jgi:hypothetical protein
MSAAIKYRKRGLVVVNADPSISSAESHQSLQVKALLFFSFLAKAALFIIALIY